MTVDAQARPAQAAPFKVLVIGGSYAGLSACLNILDLCSGQIPRCGERVDESPAYRVPIDVEVTIVDERDGFFHVIGTPLAMASNAYAEKAWVKFEDIPALQRPKIRVVQGSARSVDPASKTAIVTRTGGGPRQDELLLGYDFLVAATGLRRVWPVVPQSLLRKRYLAEVGSHVRDVAGAGHGVLVVGGGAVGVEMAAELKLEQPHVEVTLAHSRDRLLSSEGLPDDCKDAALELLREAGVRILMGHRLLEQVEVTLGDGTATATEARFTNGHKLLVDKVVMAMSNSVPSAAFLPNGALDAEGYVRIQPNLSFPSEIPNAMNHFAAGDLASWSGIKRCGGAMHMGFYTAANIHQLMLQQLTGYTPRFKELGHIPPMIGLAVGKKAVSHGPGEGTKYGEDVMRVFFGDDLGFTICWNYLKLGGDKIVQ